MWTELSDTAILNKLGMRLKASRISSGLKQQELAAESGVGVSTIAKIENGQSVSLSLLISVMRTLGLLENLDLLVPEQKPSPMELLKMHNVMLASLNELAPRKRRNEQITIRKEYAPPMAQTSPLWKVAVQG